MKVTELIEKIETTKKLKKNYDFSKHLKITYLPYLTKISMVKRIFETVSFVSNDDSKLYVRDIPMTKLFFDCRMINTYTDIEIEEPSSDYDALHKAGIFTSLLAVIPEAEYEACINLLDMVQSDYEYNNRNLLSYLETKGIAMQEAIKMILDVVERAENQRLSDGAINND